PGDKEGFAENQFRMPNPTWSQKQAMEAVERNLGKIPFDVGIRGMYIVDNTKGGVHGPNIGNLRWIWKPFNNPGYLNSIEPDNSTGHNIFDYPWQDFRDMYRLAIARRYVDAYRRRSYFHNPWTGAVNVMTNESIATLWHFPGSTVAAPGLTRIPATKGAPPPNLPIS
ncbi:MAG: hypothetical protein MN733_28750, partial [Nitrososphaera sp.]|nr:hypothetical protein [Nitrososphaera sp.]